MKNNLLKSVLLFMFGISIFMCFSFATTEVKASVFEPRYSVNAPDMSEEELTQFYIENQIFSATPPTGTTDMLEGESSVEPHLISRFPGYSSWHKTGSGSNSVSFTYVGEPLEVDESDPDIQISKDLAGITYDAIGCGPLAMVSQFDYLARYSGYTSLAKNPDAISDKRLLAREIFENTYTIPADSWLGELLGVDPNAGTFTFPSEFISGARTVLKNHYLAIPKTGINDEGNTYTYYDNDSQIVVYGDTLPSLSSFSTKINNIKDSIDKGMPVVWWTFGDAGEFSNHYMNIFAYETWVGTNADGQITSHLMFKLRFNWGIDDVYMDSELLRAVNGGFIYFEETHEKALINPSDYNFNGQYYFTNYGKYVTSSVGYKTFYTNRLRTGYVNHYDSTNTYVDAQYLVLSAKRANAGVAYLEYTFNTPIDWIYFDVRWWSSSEGISQFNGEALLQYKDSSGNWVTAIDLQRDISYPYLSTLEDYPSKLHYRFDQPIYEFRFYVQSNNPTGDRNKGRLVIGELNVFFTN